MIKAVIFDMDGLLIDSEPLWRKAEIEVFAKCGIILSDDDCRKTTGMRVDEVIKHWATIYPKAKLNVNETLNAIMEKVTALVVDKGEAMSGVYRTIEFFKNKNMLLALASASNYNLISTVVNKLNIKQEFATIESAENLQYGKPHPEIFLTTANKLNVRPEECLVFEDSLYGVLAGKAAKMKVVAVPEEANYNKKEFAIADAKITSLELFSSDLYEQLQNEIQ